MSNNNFLDGTQQSLRKFLGSFLSSTSSVGKKVLDKSTDALVNASNGTLNNDSAKLLCMAGLVVGASSAVYALIRSTHTNSHGKGFAADEKNAQEILAPMAIVFVMGGTLRCIPEQYLLPIFQAKTTSIALRIKSGNARFLPFSAPAPLFVFMQGKLPKMSYSLSRHVQSLSSLVSRSIACLELRDIADLAASSASSSTSSSPLFYSHSNTTTASSLDSDETTNESHSAPWSRTGSTSTTMPSCNTSSQLSGSCQCGALTFSIATPNTIAHALVSPVLAHGVPLLPVDNSALSVSLNSPTPTTNSASATAAFSGTSDAVLGPICDVLPPRHHNPTAPPTLPLSPVLQNARTSNTSSTEWSAKQQIRTRIRPLICTRCRADALYLCELIHLTAEQSLGTNKQVKVFAPHVPPANIQNFPPFYSCYLVPIPALRATLTPTSPSADTPTVNNNNTPTAHGTSRDRFAASVTPTTTSRGHMPIATPLSNVPTKTTNAPRANTQPCTPLYVVLHPWDARSVLPPPVPPPTPAPATTINSRDRNAINRASYLVPGPVPPTADRLNPTVLRLQEGQLALAEQELCLGLPVPSDGTDASSGAQGMMNLGQTQTWGYPPNAPVTPPPRSHSGNASAGNTRSHSNAPPNWARYLSDETNALIPRGLRIVQPAAIPSHWIKNKSAEESPVRLGAQLLSFLLGRLEIDPATLERQGLHRGGTSPGTNSAGGTSNSADAPNAADAHLRKTHSNHTTSSSSNGTNGYQKHSPESYPFLKDKLRQVPTQWEMDDPYAPPMSQHLQHHQHHAHTQLPQSPTSPQDPEQEYNSASRMDPPPFPVLGGMQHFSRHPTRNYSAAPDGRAMDGQEDWTSEGARKKAPHPSMGGNPGGGKRLSPTSVAPPPSNYISDVPNPRTVSPPPPPPEPQQQQQQQPPVPEILNQELQFRRNLREQVKLAMQEGRTTGGNLPNAAVAAKAAVLASAGGNNNAKRVSPGGQDLRRADGKAVRPSWAQEPSVTGLNKRSFEQAGIFLVGGRNARNANAVFSSLLPEKLLQDPLEVVPDVKGTVYQHYVVQPDSDPNSRPQGAPSFSDPQQAKGRLRHEVHQQPLRAGIAHRGGPIRAVGSHQRQSMQGQYQQQGQHPRAMSDPTAQARGIARSQGVHAPHSSGAQSEQNFHHHQYEDDAHQQNVHDAELQGHPTRSTPTRWEEFSPLPVATLLFDSATTVDPQDNASKIPSNAPTSISPNYEEPEVTNFSRFDRQNNNVASSVPVVTQLPALARAAPVSGSVQGSSTHNDGSRIATAPQAHTRDQDRSGGAEKQAKLLRRGSVHQGPVPSLPSLRAGPSPTASTAHVHDGIQDSDPAPVMGQVSILRGTASLSAEAMDPSPSIGSEGKYSSNSERVSLVLPDEHVAVTLGNNNAEKDAPSASSNSSGSSQPQPKPFISTTNTNATGGDKNPSPSKSKQEHQDRAVLMGVISPLPRDSTRTRDKGRHSKKGSTRDKADQASKRSGGGGGASTLSALSSLSSLSYFSVLPEHSELLVPGTLHLPEAEELQRATDMGKAILASQASLSPAANAFRPVASSISGASNASVEIEKGQRSLILQKEQKSKAQQKEAVATFSAVPKGSN